ncbi:MAG: ectoine hydroxylase-related dioxygenase (phytanoyl-CoA dioxygenase family) [Gammaproteobacteria bacterium]
MYRPVNFDNPEQEYRHDRNELPLPPVDHSGLQSKVLSNATRAGDMLVWKSYTLHGAAGNQLNQRRAAFSVNWLGDDVVYNREASLETYSDPGQVVGQPITCSNFPLVRKV